MSSQLDLIFVAKFTVEEIGSHCIGTIRVGFSALKIKGH